LPGTHANEKITGLRVATNIFLIEHCQLGKVILILIACFGNINLTIKKNNNLFLFILI
jgi:hypothetical protein